MNSTAQKSRLTSLIKIRFTRRDEGGVNLYTVYEVQNTTKFVPGDCLDQDMVDDLISSGTRITITR